MKTSKQLPEKIAVTAVIVLSVCLIVFLVIAIVRQSGRNKLKNASSDIRPSLETIETEVKPEKVLKDDADVTDWQEGDIRYDGDIYRYNSDILTFLVLGIDKKEKISDAPVTDYLDGGQADTIFLAAVNEKKGGVSVIAINRNTMADVDVYDADNAYVETRKCQITLQHGYGDGKEESCQRTADAVSRYMYGIPINGYVSVNMGAVPEMNDAVGGVDVFIDEEIYGAPASINDHVGETVTLKGNDAYIYVHNRDIEEFGSADERLLRQKKYLRAFIEKAKSKTKEKITFPLDLYGLIKDYTVTDLSAVEIGYLSSNMFSYDVDDDIYSVNGETVMGEMYEEFYPDKDDLLKLIIDIYYEKL